MKKGGLETRNAAALWIAPPVKTRDFIFSQVRLISHVKETQPEVLEC